jgi:hypothetical protein
MSHPKIVAQITTQLANVDKDGDEYLKSDEDEKTIQLFKLYLDLNDKPDNEQLIKDFVCDDDENCNNNKDFLVKNIETVKIKLKKWHDEAYAPRPSTSPTPISGGVFVMPQMNLDPSPTPPVPAGGRKISKKYKKSKKSKKSKRSRRSMKSKKFRKTKSRRH